MKRRSTVLLEVIAVLTGLLLLATAASNYQSVPTAASSTARQSIIDRWLAAPVGTVTADSGEREVKHFILEIHEIDHELVDGVTVKAWAFGFPGEEPTVPGPEIRVTEGDLVKITLRNMDRQPHTIHSHGITTVAQSMDGVPHTSLQLMPGEEYTYEFVAPSPGTHMYHCHVQTYLHMDMGMYGPFIVEPRDTENQLWDKDFVLTLDEWDSNQNHLAPLHDPDYNYFLINGKAFPDIEPIEILPGEVALVRLINAGYLHHSMHLHGNDFLVIAKDGNDLESPYVADTLPIAPGERYDILIKGRDGDFPFHDHYVQHVTNDGIYPGGMHMMILGGQEKLFRSGERPKAAPIGSDPTVDEEAARTTAMRSSRTGSAGSSAHSAAGHSGASHGAASHGGHGAASIDPETVYEGSVEISIDTLAYSPEKLRVKAGTTVTWVNNDLLPHTVTAGRPQDPPASRLFDSSNGSLAVEDMIQPGESWSYTFDKPGEYAYFCLPHPFMTGVIEVVG